VAHVCAAAGVFGEPKITSASSCMAALLEEEIGVQSPLLLHPVTVAVIVPVPAPSPTT
jgi:hypothetical protein